MTPYNPKDYWHKRGADYKGSDKVLVEIENLKKLVCVVGEQNTKLLEVGSGYGRIYKELFLDNEFINKDNYSMCDFAQSMRYNCLQNINRLPDYWDGKILPYSDNQFDFVISFSVFLHVPPCEIERIFAEHVRVCKKHFFVATYNTGLKKLARHCFEHDYKKLFEKYDLKIIDEKFFQDGLRVNWLLKVQE